MSTVSAAASPGTVLADAVFPARRVLARDTALVIG